MREVPVHHVEEVLNVTPVAKVHYREEPRVTVREQIRERRIPIYREEEEVVPVPVTYVTEPIPVIVMKPETKLTPHYIRGEPQVVTKEETVSYQYPYTVVREEVVLKNEVKKVAVERNIDSVEERIREVPQTQVEYREVEVPEVTTVRKVKYVPTFEMQTDWRPVEPIAGRPIPREPIVGEPVVPSGAREPLGSARTQMSFDGIDRNRDGFITREELRTAMGERAPPDDPNADGLNEELGSELRRLREHNRLLEDESRRMQDQLRQYQREADELAEELSKERRSNRELGARLHLEPQLLRMMLSPRHAARAIYESKAPQAGSPQHGRPRSVGPAVRRAVGEWMSDVAC